MIKGSELSSGASLVARCSDSRTNLVSTEVSTSIVASRPLQNDVRIATPFKLQRGDRDALLKMSRECASRLVGSPSRLATHPLPPPPHLVRTKS